MSAQAAAPARTMSPQATSSHLDVRNVMWLLAAMSFVVAPHLARLPQWVTIFFSVVIAWRAWIAWSALRSPPRLLMWAITVAAAVGTFLTYGRIFGREAGTTLLIIMAALKLLEMRSQRDVVLSIYLGFVLVVTNFLFSQTIPLGLYMLACVWFFVATLIGFNHVGRPPTVMQRLKPAGALLLQALPLMAAFFILFPRAQGPLFALPQDGQAGRTGLSDTMSPGNIANLIKSDALAFRVQFEDRLPPYQALYWRGPVLVDFDGITWRMPEIPGSGAPRYSKQERPTRYAVTLEPHQKNWLFALDVPGELPRGTFMLADLQLRSYRQVNQRLRYDITSYLDYTFGERASDVALAPALRFDEARNPRTVALGREWAAADPSPRAILRKAGQYFTSNGFTYTLEPPLLDKEHPYDDFVFNTRLGFCEHFAGSFVLLMRAAGIPARVVTGYQGGEVNPLNNELIVRQADAHAWAEIWIRGDGWLRIDPTAVVSPVRVDGGVNAALGPIGMLPTLIAADKWGLLANLRFAWQMMNSQWDQWIVGYNMDRQRQFFSNMGAHNIDWRTLGFWMWISTLVIGIIVAIGLRLRDRRPPREAALVAWDRFCRKLAAAGLARAPHEGPMDYLARLKSTRPAIGERAEEITMRYVQARYGEGASREELRALSRLVKGFSAA
jgi:transglutaminase-like putative cysteine protease